MCVYVWTPLQYHSPPEHEAGDRCQPPQGDHCEGHLGSAAAAAQALQVQPHLSGANQLTINTLFLEQEVKPCLFAPHVF